MVLRASLAGMRNLMQLWTGMKHVSRELQGGAVARLGIASCVHNGRLEHTLPRH